MRLICFYSHEPSFIHRFSLSGDLEVRSTELRGRGGFVCRDLKSSLISKATRAIPAGTTMTIENAIAHVVDSTVHERFPRLFVCVQCLRVTPSPAPSPNCNRPFCSPDCASESENNQFRLRSHLQSSDQDQLCSLVCSAVSVIFFGSEVGARHLLRLHDGFELLSESRKKDLCILVLRCEAALSQAFLHPDLQSFDWRQRLFVITEQPTDAQSLLNLIKKLFGIALCNTFAVKHLLDEAQSQAKVRIWVVIFFTILDRVID
jgi:hypothetical protein